MCMCWYTFLQHWNYFFTFLVTIMLQIVLRDGGIVVSSQVCVLLIFNYTMSLTSSHHRTNTPTHHHITTSSRAVYTGSDMRRLQFYTAAEKKAFGFDDEDNNRDSSRSDDRLATDSDTDADDDMNNAGDCGGAVDTHGWTVKQTTTSSSSPFPSLTSSSPFSSLISSSSSFSSEALFAWDREVVLHQLPLQPQETLWVRVCVSE